MGSQKTTAPPRALASPVRKDKVRPTVTEAGLWGQGRGDKEGTQLGIVKKLWPGALGGS